MANQEAPARPKRPRKLTTKQLKFVKNKAKGMTGVAAAQSAYGLDYRSANAMAVENMQKPTIQQAVEAEMLKQGITIGAIIKPVADGLKANKQNEYTGEVYADHSIRLKSSSMAAQFMGIGKQIENTGGIHFHNHTDGTREEYGL